MQVDTPKLLEKLNLGIPRAMNDESSKKICFAVNGKVKFIENPDPSTTLLHYLRRQLRLTGTKEACGEGGCGACTVMVSKLQREGDDTNISRYWSVNSCLLPLCLLDGLAVTTIEGIGSTRTTVHPCQESIAHGHGSQCGYCTPGMIMSMYTLMQQNNGKLCDIIDIEESLYGNLCRCTGYRPILDSFRTLSCPSQNATVERGGGVLCSNNIDTIETTPLESIKRDTPLHITGTSDIVWYRPVDLEQLLTLKDDNPHSQLVAGGISLGLQINEKGGLLADSSVYIALTHIPELQTMIETERGLLVGAMVCISQLEEKLKEVIFKLPSNKVMRLKAMLEMLDHYGGPQIKNLATVGGNVMNPGSDIMTVLVGVKAIVHIMSKKSQREVVLDSIHSTFQLRSNEILISILLPLSNENEHVAVFKQTRRKRLDTSIVSACLWMKVEPIDLIINECQLIYGGLSTGSLSVASETERKIIGKKLNNELLTCVCHSLTEEFHLPEDDNMRDYKINLCLSFFFKFYLKILSSLTVTSERDKSAIRSLPQGPIKGSQGFQKQVPNHEFVGQPLMHLSAQEQATGEAKYVDDLPCYDGEGYIGLILSQAAHALFTVDYSALEGMEGVLGYVSADDVIGDHNVTGLGNDEVIFADKKVTSVGQLIAMVVANSKSLAERAAQAVKVIYTHLPAILSMEEAISVKSYFEPQRCIKSGNVDRTLESADYVVDGEMKLGGQEQFYMETFSCLVIPKGEHNELQIIASTQNLSECQKFVAKALGISQNCVTVKITRLGGGFGGKETRCNIVYSAVAVAANKFQIPVRMIMSRGQDMLYSGARHPFLGKYKVGFSKEGKIEALDIDIYLNGGHSEDLSVRVMEGTIVNIQSVYYIPHASIRGHVCRTNMPSNTAMRGFGTPEALMIMESILTHLAHTLQIDKITIQKMNYLKNGQEFVYGMKVENSTIERCTDTLISKCQYYERQKEIEEFNKNNKWKKRGIALVPTIHGMGFYEYLPLNQSGALIHVYTDGSVLLSHGGVEMGQGLHTKMVQICAKCLSVSIDKIHISETSTDKVPNQVPTSASVSTDYNGIAVQDACQQILSAMQPFIDDNPNGTWEEWVEAAYTGRVSLSARGFCKTLPFGIKFADDGYSSRGNAYLYHTYGVGCSIVEVDTLTGSWQILRSDLLMDVGDSLNPAIDIGQVEGAFTQGLGLFTMEELIFSQSDGQLYTRGPNTYKIPGCCDVPIEFNVSLLDRCPNPKAIFSSKGIGEPPLFLAASVFFAIREAVKSARVESGGAIMANEYFEFHSPATTERIRLACRDQFTDMIL